MATARPRLKSRVQRVALALACVVVGVGCPGDDDGIASAGTGTESESTGVGSTTGGELDTSPSTGIDPDTSGDATSTSSVCGDGVTEGAEVCDDANRDDGDGCSSDCATATCLVPVTHRTIQIGVLDEACPTVWVASGSYDEFVDIGRDVEVVGSGRAAPVLDVLGQGRPIDVAAGIVVALRRFEIAGGDTEEGGAIRSSGVLVLDDVVVRDSRVEGDLPCGGGIWSDGELELRASSVRDNDSVLAADGGTASGGGVCIAAGSLRLTEGTLVTGNVARANGPGAIAAEGGGIFVADGVIEIDTGSEVALNRIEIIDATTNAIGRGAGLRQQGGTLAIADARIADNSIDVAGAPGPEGTFVAEGGGLALLAVDTTITGTSISGNTALASGPGDSIARGGGLRVSGLATLAIDLSSIVDNTARATADAGTSTATGGGMWSMLGNGALGDALAVVVERSAITGNTADAETIAEGGGIALTAQGGDSRIELAVVDSTLSGDQADVRGGAIAAAPAIGTEIAIVVRSTTITACEAGEGGGLWLDSSSGIVTVDAASSALVDNLGSAAPDCAPAQASVDSTGHNAFGALACMVTGGAGTDLLAVAALLAPLADNGGPTMTHALDPTSPLRNAGDPAGCVDEEGLLLDTDQRGEDRHAEGVCDIGAFELSP